MQFLDWIVFKVGTTNQCTYRSLFLKKQFHLMHSLFRSEFPMPLKLFTKNLLLLEVFPQNVLSFDRWNIEVASMFLLVLNSLVERHIHFCYHRSALEICLLSDVLLVTVHLVLDPSVTACSNRLGGEFNVLARNLRDRPYVLQIEKLFRIRHKSLQLRLYFIILNRFCFAVVTRDIFYTVFYGFRWC